MAQKGYVGDVVFVDGVHYAATTHDEDDEGNKRAHADLRRPLRWDEATSGWRTADANEPLHNDVHHQRIADIVPGAEENA